MSSMAAESLATYKGDCLVYVGEGFGGCTADDDFFMSLDDGWELVKEIQILQWFGMHDTMMVYERKRGA